MTVDVAFMIHCGLRDYHSDGFKCDGFKCDDLGIVKWQKNASFVDFIKQAFAPQLTPIAEQRQKDMKVMKHKKALKAWKLERRYGIEIKTTNNLLEHLAYDPPTMTLKVFHQMSFLRAQLQRTKGESLDLGFEDSLKKGFDQEAKWIEYVRPLPSEMTYTYWGDRLAKLYDVVKRPPPTNPVVAWFERHTSERNALTVAIIGLFLAVLLGFLSFIVGLMSLIVAWMAWKYPVS
ncbi:hypothetical protein QQZ08_008868 [Neonectria magnoliae]|uniref:Uncharacterized protein n=1 Tax=Neonectria magnoliae TaxID=2732573 RepID=A0ABR1HRH2_9HYPO